MGEIVRDYINGNFIDDLETDIIAMRTQKILKDNTINGKIKEDF